MRKSGVKNKCAKIVIKGHTDSISKKSYNMQLSRARAKSLRQYLINKFGIDGSRITTCEEDELLGSEWVSKIVMKRILCIRYILRLVILLSGAILAIQGVVGFSDASRTPATHGNYSHVKVVRAPQNLVLRSASALVEDQRTGECLVQKQAEAVLPIASITKLMTAMVVLDAKMDLQESLTIVSEDVDTLRHSRSRLPVNTRLTRGDALLLALMASENRAAHALGRTYPGGLGAFVAAMNAKARSLGLAETRFEDPTGISSGNVSSARDLARMVDAAYHYRLIREFTTCKEATIHSGRRTLAIP